MKLWIVGTIIIGVAILIPGILLIYGNVDIIKNRHIQLTSDKAYIEKLTCKDLFGNETQLESVTTFDVLQLKNDIKNLEKEKDCI